MARNKDFFGKLGTSKKGYIPFADEKKLAEVKEGLVP